MWYLMDRSIQGGRRCRSIVNLRGSNSLPHRVRIHYRSRCHLNHLCYTYNRTCSRDSLTDNSNPRNFRSTWALQMGTSLHTHRLMNRCRRRNNREHYWDNSTRFRNLVALLKGRFLRRSSHRGNMSHHRSSKGNLGGNKFRCRNHRGSHLGKSRSSSR